MVCRLFIAKPLSEPMLRYCQLDPNFSEILFKIQNFSFTKMHLKQKNFIYTDVWVTREAWAWLIEAEWRIYASVNYHWFR